MNRNQCKSARGLLDITQKELSEKIGCTTKTIADFENGHTTPQTRTIKDIERYLESLGIVFEENEKVFNC